MSSKSETNLILNINVSWLLTGLLAAVHLGAAGLIAATPMPWSIRFGLWSALGASLYYTLGTYARRTRPWAVRALELDNEGALHVRLLGEETWRAARMNSRFVHPWLTLMSVRLDSRRWPVSVVIAADAVEAEPFRRWRVALRSQAPSE